MIAPDAISVKNFGGNISFTPRHICRPTSLESLSSIILSTVTTNNNDNESTSSSAPSPSHIRVFGGGHSFNGGIEVDDKSISVTLAHLMDVQPEIDENNMTMWVPSYYRYADIVKALNDHHQQGGRLLALRNLASLPHISIGGATATATHGSGVNNGNLATHIIALTLVNGQGEIMTISRDSHPKTFDGMVVHAGCLGVIARMQVSLVPFYFISQHVYENLSLKVTLKHFKDIMSNAYSVSLFTNFQHSDRIQQVWLKKLVSDNTPTPSTGEFYGALAATENQHPVNTLNAAPCTQQMGLPGAWHDRLPHFRIEFTPSCGNELQSEYFVSLEDGAAAVSALLESPLRESIADVLQIAEVRCIAADDLWLSPSYHRTSIGIHFTWKNDYERIIALLPSIEEALAPFGVRPHFGKLFTMNTKQLQTVYPKWNDFINLRKEMDPHNIFQNEWARTLFQ